MKVITSSWRDQSCLNIFPDQRRQPVTLSKSDLVFLSDELEGLYDELITVFAKSFQSSLYKSQIQDESLKIVLRGVLVTLTYPFFERLMRVNKLINQNKNSLLTFIDEDCIFTVKTLEDFHDLLGCEKFNNALISDFSKVWGLKKNKLKEGVELDKSFTGHKYHNNLFKLNIGWLRLKIFNLIRKVFKVLPSIARFPVLTFANSENAFLLKGFYFRYFKQINWREISDFSINKILRDEVFTESLVQGSKFCALLSAMNFSQSQSFNIRKIFLQYIKKSYPTQLLEGLHTNYKSILLDLNRFSQPFILMATSLSQTESLLIISAAKQRNMKIINSQHGGHYGYIKGVTAFSELEWAVNDVFLSWGWVNRQAINPKLEIIPMPSPWLSERRKYWQLNKFNKEKEFDILWMPQRMNLYTGSPQGLSCIRPDVILDLSKLMINFVQTTTDSKLRVYCKPYDYLSIKAMSDTYEFINSLGEFYKCGLPDQKGLNYDLINKANLVVWDQPGTGFLECLSCDIPTMILWDRVYSEEMDYATLDFKSLEAVGIVHRSPESLCAEYKKYIKNSHTWTTDAQRVAAIKKFINKYALIDDGWEVYWSNYLKQHKC